MAFSVTGVEWAQYLSHKYNGTPVDTENILKQFNKRFSGNHNSSIDSKLNFLFNYETNLKAYIEEQSKRTPNHQSINPHHPNEPKPTPNTGNTHPNPPQIPANDLNLYPIPSNPNPFQYFNAETAVSLAKRNNVSLNIHIHQNIRHQNVDNQTIIHCAIEKQDVTNNYVGLFKYNRVRVYCVHGCHKHSKHKRAAFYVVNTAHTFTITALKGHGVSEKHKKWQAGGKGTRSFHYQCEKCVESGTNNTKFFWDQDHPNDVSDWLKHLASTHRLEKSNDGDDDDDDDEKMSR